MHFIKKNFIENGVISCQICVEEFYSKKEKIPIVLNCGHTICKQCLDNNLKKGREKCPIDNQTKIEIVKNKLIENKIIKKTIELLSMKIDIKSLSNLNFYYCLNCDEFFSSISIQVHKAINHNINSIDSYSLEWFDYIFQNININSKIASNMVKMFLILYFFQSPYLLTKQKINVMEKKNYNKNKYLFFGEIIDKNESNDKLYSILMSVLSDNHFDNSLIKKGILIGENFQLIQGYFLIKENKNIISKGLCVFNIENFSFFGIIKFSIYPLSTGFCLDIGILNDNDDYYFGKFKDSIELPIFELESGEKIYCEDNIIKVEKTNVNEKYFEYLDKNKYFSIQKAGNDFKKVSFNNINIQSQFNPKIDIIIENNTLDIKSLEITYVGENNINNNIMISKKNINENPEILFLFQTKILLERYGITFFFNENNDYLIITSNDKEECFCYLFSLPQNIISIRFLNLLDLIHDINYFIKSIEDILNCNLTLCHVYYEKMNPYEFNRIGEIYIKIETFDNKILCGNGKKLIKEYQCNEMMNMSIKELLPNFYECDIFKDFKFKKEIKNFLENKKNSTCKCSIF